ncbi:MAG: hypothetical protein C0501_17550 [Isosphaera sp.]|nr:hypothetical protein [Isosphaera sp.]
MADTTEQRERERAVRRAVRVVQSDGYQDLKAVAAAARELAGLCRNYTADHPAGCRCGNCRRLARCAHPGYEQLVVALGVVARQLGETLEGDVPLHCVE